MTAEPPVRRPDPTAVAETTLRVLAELSGREPAGLTDDLRLFRGLGLSSGNALELLMRLEDELELDLTATALDWRHLESVGSLKRYVAERAGLPDASQPSG